MKPFLSTCWALVDKPDPMDGSKFIRTKVWLDNEMEDILDDLYPKNPYMTAYDDHSNDNEKTVGQQLKIN